MNYLSYSESVTSNSASLMYFHSGGTRSTFSPNSSSSSLPSQSSYWQTCSSSSCNTELKEIKQSGYIGQYFVPEKIRIWNFYNKISQKQHLEYFETEHILTFTSSYTMEFFLIVLYMRDYSLYRI